MNPVNVPRIAPMGYSDKLMDYVENPRFPGEVVGADAVVTVTKPVCGDGMELWLKFARGIRSFPNFPLNRPVR